VGLAWTLGLVTSAAVFVTVPGLVLRAELAFAIGSLVGLFGAVAGLWRTEFGAGRSSKAARADDGIRP